MDKRYQVFVSSTYEDLREERQEVMQALLELDCIPAGMELFPAADEDQWSLIKRVIDDSDYYVVIVAGRYGSLAPSGISYTQMEYEYAAERGKPVIAFLHSDPAAIPARKTETTDAGRQALEKFRELVKQRVCKPWTSPKDLGGVVSRSIIHLIKSRPGTGWVRANQVSGAASQEILRLRKRIDDLESRLAAIRLEPPPGTADLAQGDEIVQVAFRYRVTGSDDHTSTVSLPWNELFASVSPMMIERASDYELRLAIAEVIGLRAAAELETRHGRSVADFRVIRPDFQKIKIQFRALGLIEIDTAQKSIRDTATYWKLTPYGDHVMTKLNAIRSGRAEGRTSL